MTKKAILTLLLTLSLSLSTIALVGAQTQPEYVLALQGPTWDHSVITVLVVPKFDEAWWNPSYLNSTLHAIDQWNEAISYFASTHSDFAYLSLLRMEPQVSNSTIGGFDAYVSWIEQFGNETCEAGLTRTTYASSNIIINSTLTFSAYDCRGNILSETDMQNVALHELGHNMGLGHANFSGDPMYYAYTLNSPVRAISTLDVYGVGTVFRWMAYSQEFDPVNQGPPIYSVTLPLSIKYEYLPISEKDLPPQSAIDQIRIFLDNLPEFILQPEVLILILIAASAVIAYITITRVRRRPVVSRQPDAFTQKAMPRKKSVPRLANTTVNRIRLFC
jgi:hypothetical protein